MLTEHQKLVLEDLITSGDTRLLARVLEIHAARNLPIVRAAETSMVRAKCSPTAYTNLAIAMESL